MSILKRLSIGLCTLAVMLCAVIPHCSVSVSANELTDSILNEWHHDYNNEYGDIYSCPEIDYDADKVLDCCISIVNEKKGELITDEYSLFLCFDYSTDMFSSAEKFEEYYVWNVYYPLFALYPESTFCASTMSYYGGDDNGYTIMIELCLNGKPHNYLEVNGEIFKGLEQYENERFDLSAEIVRLADEAMNKYPDDYNRVKYVYDYLVKNVAYNKENPDYLRSHSSYGALIDKLAVCQGYAAAMQDVCYLMDIPCIMNFSDNHGWNSIYIDGKWRFVDATNGFFMTVDEEQAPIVYEKYDLYDNYPEVINKVHEKLEYWNNLGISYDVNNDGNTTSEDALMILNCTIGVYTENEILIRADIDGDGNVTSYDALIILQSVVGM